jgi:hypothetical protein
VPGSQLSVQPTASCLVRTHNAFSGSRQLVARTRRDRPSRRESCGWRIVISSKIPQDSPSCYDSLMRNLAVLIIHFIAVPARLLGPGVRSLVAESLLLKHRILILNRSRKRSPNLHASDRILAGLMALLVRPTRLLGSAIVLKPSTLLAIHKALSKGKYRMLFFPDRRRQPGPKGQLIREVVEMKQRNLNWGCPQFAQQMALAFRLQRQRRGSQDSRPSLRAGTAPPKARLRLYWLARKVGK